MKLYRLNFILFAFVEKHHNELVLPDQDVLNAMYGDKIFRIDDALCNYDVQWAEIHYMVSGSEKNLDWVIRNTSVLHFCGKNKPWHRHYTGHFAALYKHYMNLVSIEKAELLKQ